MNLREEMMGQSDCANNWNLEEIKVGTNLHLIEVKEAIAIAEKYAEEMCNKQREICKNYCDENGRDFDDYGSKILDNAPLATEVNNSNTN